MTTETAGVRENDTGALPDRYARGWHCLGPVTDYLDGKPHGVECPAPCWSSSRTRTASSRCWTATAATWAATCRRAPSRATRSPAVPRLAVGRRQASNSCRTPSAPRASPAPRRGTPTCAAVCCSSGTTTRATRLNTRCGSPTSPSPPTTSGPMEVEHDPHRGRQLPRDHRQRHRHGALLLHPLRPPTYFKNVFEGHIASQYLHNVGRPDVNDLGTSYGEAHLIRRTAFSGHVLHDQPGYTTTTAASRPSRS